MNHNIKETRKLMKKNQMLAAVSGSVGGAVANAKGLENGNAY